MKTVNRKLHDFLDGETIIIAEKELIVPMGYTRGHWYDTRISITREELRKLAAKYLKAGA